MGEAATRSEEAVVKLQEGLTDLASQVTDLTTTQQQVTVQLELANRAVADHAKFADNMDRRHDALARQMTALGAAMDRMVNGRTTTRDEDDGDTLHGIPVGLGVYASIPAAAASLAASGGGARPETHSLARSAEQAALGGGRPRSSHEVLCSGAASGGGRPRSC
jgi:hypothetical protein